MGWTEEKRYENFLKGFYHHSMLKDNVSRNA